MKKTMSKQQIFDKTVQYVMDNNTELPENVESDDSVSIDWLFELMAIAATVGAVDDLQPLRDFAKKYNLYYIMDN